MAEYARAYATLQNAEHAVARLRGDGFSDDSISLTEPKGAERGWVVRVEAAFGRGRLALDALDRFDPITAEVRTGAWHDPGTEGIHELSKPVSPGAIHELSKRVSPGAIARLSGPVSPGAISRLSGRKDPGAIARLSGPVSPGAISRLSGRKDPGAISRLSGPVSPGAISSLSGWKDPGAISHLAGPGSSMR